MLDARRASRTRLELALGIAARSRAHLTAVLVDLPPQIGQSDSASFARGAGIEDIAERYHRSEDIELKWQRERLELQTKRSEIGLAIRTLPVNSTLREAVMQCRYVDLAILPPSVPVDESNRAMLWSSGDVVVSAGVPCLYVPTEFGLEPFAQRVVIGWNASREARRVIGDALWLLSAAHSVSVILIDPKTGMAAHGEDPGFDIAQFLARHDIRVDIERHESHGERVDDILLRRARELNADLIVAGAYGHSRMIEFVLGSTTRALLERATVPVFLAH